MAQLTRLLSKVHGVRGVTGVERKSEAVVNSNR